MNVEQLIIALERRAMDREKVVVVQTHVDKLTEVGDVVPESGLIVLKLWRPPTTGVS